MYPRIINRVIKHADSELLAAFSLTSKAYRDCYRRLVGPHLIMHNGKVPRITITSHRGKLPIRSQQTAQLKALMKRKSTFFKHCTTLDIAEDLAASLQFTLVLPQLQTLRLFLNPGGFRKALPHLANTSIVLFGAFPFYDMYWSGIDVWYGPILYPKDKVVWNVTDFYCPDVRSNRVDLRHVKEFVLHFNISPDARLKSCLINKMTATLEAILKRSMCYPVQIVFKLVGFDNIPLEDVNFAHENATSIEERRGWILHQFGDVGNRIVFMSPEEYCAEIGGEAYDIETCPQLW